MNAKSICKANVSRLAISAWWPACLVVLLILGTLPAISVADTGAEGTWSGTFHSSVDGATGPLTITIAGSSAATVQWVEDLTSWGLSGTVTITINGSYTYNSGTGSLHVDAQGWTYNIQGYDAHAHIIANGTVSGNSASGTYTNAINVYQAGTWVDGVDDNGTWTLTRPGASGDSYEPDNSSAQATWIYSGTPQTHSIVPANDYDWVKFSLSTESKVIIETSGTAGDDTYMWLLDSNITVMEENDDKIPEVDLFSRIDRLCGVDALPAGTYYVAVAAYYVDVEIQSYNITLTVTACDGSGTSPVYRFWSPVNECHFYTMEEAEKDKLINLYAHVWTYESIAYYAFGTDSVPGLVPVYRFWSPVLETHFYTTSEPERDNLINNYPHVWTYESIAFYAYPEGQQPVDTLPIYRFWSPVLETHFYTMDETEKNKLIDNYPHVWTYESIAWYAYE